MWNEFTSKQKAPYNEMAQQDLARMQCELKQLEKLGYFITKEGIKSTDLVIKQKKSKSVDRLEKETISNKRAKY